MVRRDNFSYEVPEQFIGKRKSFNDEGYFSTKRLNAFDVNDYSETSLTRSFSNFHKSFDSKQTQKYY